MIKKNLGLHNSRTARDSGNTGARNFKQAQRHHLGDELVNLVGLACEFKHEAFS